MNYFRDQYFDNSLQLLLGSGLGIGFVYHLDQSHSRTQTGALDIAAFAGLCRTIAFYRLRRGGEGAVASECCFECPPCSWHRVGWLLSTQACSVVGDCEAGRATMIKAKIITERMDNNIYYARSNGQAVMKAIVCRGYGPPEILRLRQVPKPMPKESEVLIKIHATTVTSGDIRIRAFKVPFWEWLPARIYLGLRKPKRKILGPELAGRVEAVGKGIKRFKEGDQVFAFAGFDFGAYAEYKCLPENGPVEKGLVEIKPSNMTFEEAAAATGGALTALSHLRRGKIQSGHKILVYGASGSIGTFAIQLAKYFGAHVTGVCSATNQELVRSLGADQVIDYRQEDYSRSGPIYDVVYDAVGKMSRSRSRSALKKRGIFLSAHNPASIETQDLIFLKDLIEAGVITSVIDRCNPMEQIREAHRYVEQGHKKGNVVITLANSHETGNALTSAA